MYNLFHYLFYSVCSNAHLQAGLCICLSLPGFYFCWIEFLLLYIPSGLKVFLLFRSGHLFSLHSICNKQTKAFPAVFQKKKAEGSLSSSSQSHWVSHGGLGAQLPVALPPL